MRTPRKHPINKEVYLIRFGVNYPCDKPSFSQTGDALSNVFPVIVLYFVIIFETDSRASTLQKSCFFKFFSVNFSSLFLLKNIDLEWTLLKIKI